MLPFIILVHLSPWGLGCWVPLSFCAGHFELLCWPNSSPPGFCGQWANHAMIVMGVSSWVYRHGCIMPTQLLLIVPSYHGNNLRFGLAAALPPIRKPNGRHQCDHVNACALWCYGCGNRIVWRGRGQSIGRKYWIETSLESWKRYILFWKNSHLMSLTLLLQQWCLNGKSQRER